MQKIISQIKARFNTLPKHGKVVVSILLFVLLYKFVKNMFRKAQVKKLVDSYTHTGGSTDNHGKPFNSKACALNLWDLFYNGWTEDESKIIKILLSVPAEKRGEVNKLYKEYLLQKGHNPQNLFCIGNTCAVSFHYGDSLQADAQYYCGTRYREVEHFFNSL